MLVKGQPLSPNLHNLSHGILKSNAMGQVVEVGRQRLAFDQHGF